MKDRLISLLRWTERYTKTDMVYLVTTGIWVNLNFIIVSLLSLLLSIAFANLLPPATYGLYQYLLSLSALVGALTLSGMGNAVTQAVARGYDGVLRTSVSTQLRFALIPVALSFLGAGYYLYHGNVEVGVGLIIIGFLTPLTNAFSTFAAFLNGKKEFKQGFYLTSLITGSYYTSIFIGVFFLKSAPLLLVINLGVNALATGYAYVQTLKLYKPSRAPSSIDPNTIPYGIHLSVMSGFGIIFTQFDSVLVFHFLGPVELAVYSLATMIPERVAGLFNFIGVASLPNLATQTHGYIQRHLLSKLGRIAAASIVMSLGYAVVAPFLFHLVFPQYLEAIHYTQAYAIIIALMALLNTVNTVLIAKELKRELYIVSIVSPTLLMALQVPLLIYFGIMGILVARMVNDALGIALSLGLLFRKTTHAS